MVCVLWESQLVIYAQKHQHRTGILSAVNNITLSKSCVVTHIHHKGKKVLVASWVLRFDLMNQIKRVSVYYRIGVYIEIIGKVIYENVIV